MQAREELLDARVGDVAGAEVLAEQIRRAALRAPSAGRDPVTSAANSGSIRTSSAWGSSALTSSRRPARAGSRTHTRRKSSPTVPARADSSATVPRTVRSRLPAVIGMSVTFAGVPGEASTRQTTGVLSCSPKSMASGAPQ